MALEGIAKLGLPVQALQEVGFHVEAYPISTNAGRRSPRSLPFEPASSNNGAFTG
jgi:hypothetical protein